MTLPTRPPLPDRCHWCGSNEVLWVDAKLRGRCEARNRKRDAIAVEKLPDRPKEAAVQGRLL